MKVPSIRIMLCIGYYIVDMHVQYARVYKDHITQCHNVFKKWTNLLLLFLAVLP